MPPQTPEMWPDLVRAVDAEAGVYQTNMETLRRLEGAQRLGPAVVESIADRLKSFGIGFLPPKLPVRGDERVLLYRNGTMAAEVIRAILDGLGGSVAETAATALRTVNRSPTDVVASDTVASKAMEAAEKLQELLEAAGHPQDGPSRRRLGRRKHSS
ncbi:hypothetical protein [Streptomyces fractus]|uniref:hypothetical protein n=1 Tax=Streptomyces fractus TaxID=641806 RepID=UPI003CF385C1